MSTASAVLRLIKRLILSCKKSTYVYRFGGIETNPTHSLNNTIQGTHVYRIVCEAKQGQSNIPLPGIPGFRIEMRDSGILVSGRKSIKITDCLITGILIE